MPSFLHFFLSQISSIKVLSEFSRGLWGLDFTGEQWVDVACIAESDCCCLFVPFFLHFFSQIFKHWKISSHFSQELWSLEVWTLHTWTVGGCSVYTRIRLLLHIRFFISYFSFQLSKLIILSHFCEELCVLEGWNLVNTWTMGGCIVYTTNKLLLLIHPFSIFLSNSQTIKFFVTLFSGTVRPRHLKLVTYVNCEWTYRVYCSQAVAYSSLYFFLFLSFQYSNS